ncbi:MULTISPECIES: DNA topoisomerase IV subunit B [Chlamydia]|uniref:DNA topoisomerase (ATP-hydrolyzing) n=1 Tax=Chlamydophila parapsittaci TaxID=344886 RepID=A0ABX5VZ10_9CHLA|nr:MULTISPECIES: DNA topoisomerase IV subunit B [Chlamydia]EPP32601.1 toprim domain protein [Chlamydia psittaci C1/97]AFS20136.1 histidine kinase-, DNA gyrase B-, and HSP90-like ATPase family protein [Chlamydia psittaci GR9]AFS23408.1 histidine kinase-, DNA gyrase B-, and HSP90-like ATPase family protein [Chlamydia psittaci WS/RT/E30]EPP28914.1 toprim domain protein [Chlamydia psittaci 08-2626_L3]QDE37235.1 type IIA DNA topoisomerase subunit B [Chlamydophila parapsittaci]
MATYTEASVVSLASLEHIRLRAGMYIGRLGDGSQVEDGIYTLFKEVVDNAIDEFIMGYGKTISIFTDDSTITVRDSGRGIPLGKMIDCVSKINTGAKYTQDVFHFSVGLNGVGLKAVNALSEKFTVRSVRKKKYHYATFYKGVLQDSRQGSTKDPDGTEITFSPDPTIFTNFAFNDEFLRKKIRRYTYLHPGLEIICNNEVFISQQGLLDLFKEEIPEKTLYPPIAFQNSELSFLFSHLETHSERYFSFVNGQETLDGGSHLAAFKEAVVKGINEYFGKNFTSNDIREGIVGCIAIKIASPIFESQTKNKLGNTQIRSGIIKEVKSAIIQELKKNKSRSDLLLEKIKLNEKTRKNIQFIKQDLKDKQKKLHYKIPKLRDCKFHYNERSLYGEASSIFVTEGESASASILSSRNPLTQAVFSLRGKPMNVFSLEEEKMYKNDELFYLATALGITKNSTQHLRYNKIILATDADVDGMHIRNLLITFFLKTFLSVVENQHLFILETPLFKVRYKDTTLYCYSDQEKTQAIQKLGKKEAHIEVTRFKGLGEISPKEFKTFIGADMRLTPVTISSLESLDSLLQFYMGKNTKERKQFIMDNLITNL